MKLLLWPLKLTKMFQRQWEKMRKEKKFFEPQKQFTKEKTQFHHWLTKNDVILFYNNILDHFFFHLVCVCVFLTPFSVSILLFPLRTSTGTNSRAKNDDMSEKYVGSKFKKMTPSTATKWWRLFDSHCRVYVCCYDHFHFKIFSTMFKLPISIHCHFGFAIPPLKFFLVFPHFPSVVITFWKYLVII